ncbi:MAG: hypothetical protein ACP5MH_07410 [Thermoproteus sp.]
MSQSNILLVTLWAKPEQVLASLPEDARRMVAAATALYSKDGVNHLLASLAERLLSVDTVIVYGPDLTGSGQALIEALEGRCGDWARIPCERLGELGVAVVDLRKAYGDPARLAEEVRARYRPRPPRRRVEMPISPPRGRPGYPKPVGWGLIYDTSPYYLWVKALDYALTYGNWEGGLRTSLVAQLGLWGSRPEWRGPPPARRGVCPLDEVGRVLSGALAERQAGACRVLSARRAGGWASADVLIGGCELVEGFPGELLAVAEAFVEASEGAGLRPGLLSFLLLDAYIPAEVLDRAAGIVEAEWRTAYSRDVYDPRGNFVLGPDGLLHYTDEGILYRALGGGREVAAREAAKLLPGHAFYLGEETAARKLLGDRYRQEEWRL